MRVNVNSGPKPCPTHWSNQFVFRRRETVTADASGKPQAAIPADLLDLIGAKPGDDLIITVNDMGQILVRRPEIQIG